MVDWAKKVRAIITIFVMVNDLSGMPSDVLDCR